MLFCMKESTMVTAKEKKLMLPVVYVLTRERKK